MEPDTTLNQTPDRTRKVKELQQQQAAKAKRGRILTISTALAASAGIIALAANSAIDTTPADKLPLAQIGASFTDAECQDADIEIAEGNNDHRNPNEPITYSAAPPASGPHWPSPEGMERKFYTTQDRPAVETLVHNLEHGFTVLWYNESATGDDIDNLKAIAKKFPATTGVRDKFIVAPWTVKDGDAFPKGTKAALTHWSKGSTHGNPDTQIGVTQYCGEISGEAVKKFIKDYPFTDAPEGDLPGNM